MLMPGRGGSLINGQWQESGPAILAILSVDSRTANLPDEYIALESIEFLPGFESGSADEFVAYITTSGSGDSEGTDGLYRYGFNGKEMDNEARGSGNQYDYGARIYNPMLGRFLSTDPFQSQFPDLTPFQFAGNTPIQAIDLDGFEPLGFMHLWKPESEEVITKWGFTVQDFYDYQTRQVYTIMRYPNTNQVYYWQSENENAQKLFIPHNTSLNKQNSEWTGKFKEFVPKRIGDDRSFHYGMIGMLASPFVAIVGIEGGAALLALAEHQILIVALQSASTYYRIAPIAIPLLRNGVELLDETGSMATTGAGKKVVTKGIKNIGAETTNQLGKYADYNLARKAAMKWLEERGFKAEKVVRGKFGLNKGKPIGMSSSNGKIGFRIEYDERNGAHINVWFGKEKGPHFQFEASEKTVNEIIKRFSR